MVGQQTGEALTCDGVGGIPLEGQTQESGLRPLTSLSH